MKKQILVIFLVTYMGAISLSAQTREDYYIYSKIVNLLYQIQKEDRSDEVVDIQILTNTISDESLMHLDANFSFDGEYIFDRNKFHLRPKFFQIEDFRYCDTEGKFINLDLSDSLLNTSGSEDISNLLNELSEKIRSKINLKANKFHSTIVPAKIINYKKIDKLFKQGGRFEIDSPFKYEFYWEFSPIVYSKDYAITYVSSCSGQCYNINEFWGHILIFQKKCNDWILFAELTL